MRILTFPNSLIFPEIPRACNDQKIILEMQKRFTLGKERCIKELDCKSKGTKLNYSDIARKYALKDEKGAQIFLL